MNPSEAAVLYGLTHDRIRNLLAARQIYRGIRGAEWSPIRFDLEVELRALLTLARQARRTAQAEPDPIDRYKIARESLAYHDYQAGR